MREFRVGDRVYHIKEKLVGTIVSITSVDFSIEVRFKDYVRYFLINGEEFRYTTVGGDGRIILTHD